MSNDLITFLFWNRHRIITTCRMYPEYTIHTTRGNTVEEKKGKSKCHDICLLLNIKAFTHQWQAKNAHFQLKLDERTTNSRMYTLQYTVTYQINISIVHHSKKILLITHTSRGHARAYV